MDELPSGIDGLVGNDLCPEQSASLLAVTRAHSRAIKHAEQAQQLPEENTEAASASKQVDTDEELNLAQLFQKNKTVDRNELIRLQQSDPELQTLFTLAECTLGTF
jgi:hypothetical protein